MRETPAPALRRLPIPRLRPFVRTLWATDPLATQPPEGMLRERVLPTGEMHLVFRLSDHPVRLYDPAAGTSGRTLGHSIVGGVRTKFYVKDVSEPVRSVGAQLHPGAARLLFGASADELAERHTPLADLWGGFADEARGCLLEADDPARQIDALEAILAARLPRVRALHPAVAHALERLDSKASVRDIVHEGGWSHRWFIELFRRTMGLSPKLYSRLLRFQGAVRRARGAPGAAWADLALDAGYSDQPHFIREFREFAGITPGEYRALSPREAHHVPIRPGGR